MIRILESAIPASTQVVRTRFQPTVLAVRPEATIATGEAKVRLETELPAEEGFEWVHFHEETFDSGNSEPAFFEIPQGLAEVRARIVSSDAEDSGAEAVAFSIFFVGAAAE